MPRSSNSGKQTERRRAPVASAEERENYMIALAVDLAEKKLRDGTASNQVIAHYLRLGSTKERLEKEKLRKEYELLDAKAEAIKSSKRIEELYSNAIKAMRVYSGAAGQDFDEDEED